MDSIRVSELAKELGLTSKEVIEKFAEISIIVKSHSNTVTPVQIRKLKEYLGVLPKKNNAKPKAFVVKKAKAAADEKPAADEPKVEKTSKVIKVEKVKPAVEIKKAEKTPVRIERTKIEYPKNQSRIEIVRNIKYVDAAIPQEELYKNTNLNPQNTGW